MPTAMKSPADRLARLRRLPALAPMRGGDRARLRALASSQVEPVPDDESPEVLPGMPGVEQVNPTLAISPRNAAWFARHGGTKALNQALREWIRENSASSPRRTASA